MSNIIQIRGFDGESKSWKTLGARNADLLAAYPPKAGWAVAIDAEKAPVTFALAGTEVPTVRFTAALTDPSCRVVARVSIVHAIDTLDAWPIGEARARHRLCEALGFGGEQLDADERKLIAEHGAPGNESVQEAPASASAEPAAAPPRQRKSTAKQTAAGEPPSAMLLRQIAERAARDGITVPEFATGGEAKAFFSAMLAGKITPGGAA